MRQRWVVDELIESWTLDPADVELVANKTGPTRLGSGVLLKFFELEARLPRSIVEVPNVGDVEHETVVMGAPIRR